MPLSDWQPLPIVTTGDMWTAAQHNTYIRANQQALYDGLTGGHGQGSDVDLLDGRHGTEFFQFNQPRAITAASNGWHILATTTSVYSMGVFVIFNGAQYWKGVVTPNGIVEIDKSPPGPGVLLRIAEVPGEYRFEAYLQANETWYVAQGTPIPGASSWRQWADGPDTVDTDSVTVRDGTVAGNGLWKLRRMGTSSGAGVGWASTTEKANYTIYAYGNWTGISTSGLLDGDTSTETARRNLAGGESATAYVHIDCSYTVSLSKIRVYEQAANGATRYIKVYGSTGSGGPWTYLGQAGGTSNGTLVGLVVDFGGVYNYRYWRIEYVLYSLNYAWGAIWTEIDFYKASTFQIGNIPPGVQVNVKDGAGAVVESWRRAQYSDPDYHYFGTSVDVVDSIELTEPDGSTPWLKFPKWAIGLQNGDMLVLVST